MRYAMAAALMLSLALVVWPTASRRRLAPRSPAHSRVPPVFAWCAAGCAAAAAMALAPPPTALAAAVVAATGTLRYHRRRRRRHAANESRTLETALDVLVGELRAGAHPAQAFSVAADEAGGAVGARLQEVAARARLGADVGSGLRGVAASSALPAQWDRIAVCWQLACDHGLAISTLMRAAQRDIAERQRFSMHVLARMAGARATAAILAALPVPGVLLGQLIGAQPLRFLFGGNAGGWLLVAGLTLACGGLLWSDRITERVA
ncbi:type II secretion system F family protein [Mycobacterium sp. SM1]|uniref:type II secretion system F family protein n=1 Tax=Mycobacterium sp. SM1 TaxID=2816243 RepID=UPI001BCAFDE2|nr:type II secretion system F family protein [Mycobacterium sp. SM1]MBS4727732.1 type II secretion system F family protein [Mycobacterium sp. SM1]